MDKKVKIMLVGSVVLNLLLGGMVGGHVYKRWSAHPWHEVKEQLSPESRNLVGRTFQSAFRDIKPLGDKARKARADLVKILSADEFDEAAYDKAAAQMLEIGGEMKAHKVETIKTLASQMSVEDRRKMADRMAFMVGGGHERRVKRQRSPKMVEPEHKPGRD
ncbi:MAG: periplasmic heavy metal sensor [Rhodospirillales bacterium]|nr:periplasmic heavy metal sensor [Rhodospirillales bacterium]